MFCTVNIKNQEYNCFYKTNEKKDLPPLVILHGWGVDSSIFDNIINELNYYVIVIDFIGFGKSDQPKVAFSLEDYVNQIDQIIKKLKLKHITLLGHSFGGRVAIKYNYYYNLDNLILVDSAGIRHRSMSLYKKIIKYKFLKKVYFIFNKEKYNELINNSGSRDYKILTPIMKQTMNKVIRVDLKKYCMSTRTNTFLLWGKNDSETPISDAFVLYKTFYQSRLIVFYRSGHFPHLDEPEKFIKLVNRVNKDG